MSIGEEVTGVFTHMLHALDLRQWQAVRDAFADHVDVDYSSLFGVPAATVSSDEQIGAWRSFVGAFDATQHLTGPLVTSEREGAVLGTTSVRGYHRIIGTPGGDTWMVAGIYHVRFVHRRAGWRIVGLTLKVLYQDGNLDLPGIATGRATAPTPIPPTP
jgi:SnoaL-like domain